MGELIHYLRCGGHYRNVGRAKKKDGVKTQQQVCKKCGKLRFKEKKVRKCFLSCNMKWDRRMPRGVLKCKRCGTVKDTRKNKG